MTSETHNHFHLLNITSPLCYWMICPHYRRGVVKGCGLNSGSVLVWMDRLRALRDSRPVSCPVWWVLHPTVPDGPLLPLRPARESDRRRERGRGKTREREEVEEVEKEREKSEGREREREGERDRFQPRLHFTSEDANSMTAPLTMYLRNIRIQRIRYVIVNVRKSVLCA